MYSAIVKKVREQMKIKEEYPNFPVSDLEKSEDDIWQAFESVEMWKMYHDMEKNGESIPKQELVQPNYKFNPYRLKEALLALPTDKFEAIEEKETADELEVFFDHNNFDLLPIDELDTNGFKYEKFQPNTCQPRVKRVARVKKQTCDKKPRWWMVARITNKVLLFRLKFVIKTLKAFRLGHIDDKNIAFKYINILKAICGGKLSLNHEMDTVNVLPVENEEPVVAANTQVLVAPGISRGGLQPNRVFRDQQFNLYDMLEKFNQVDSVEWNSTHGFNTNLFEWNILPDIMSKCSSTTLPTAFKNAQFFSGDLEFLVTINSMPFMQGAAIVAINYADNNMITSSTSKQHVYSLSQKPHVLLNASSAQEAILRVPFKYPMNQIICSPLEMFDGWRYATIICRVLSPLSSANSATLKTNIIVAVRIVNPQFSGMISKNMRANLVQQLDHEMLPAALNIANRILSPDNCDYPPALPQRNRFIPTAVASLSAGTNTIDTSEILRLDPLASTPHQVYSDDFNIETIINTPGIIDQVSVKVSDNVNTIVYKREVSPLSKRTNYKVAVQGDANKSTTYVIPPVGVIGGLYSYFRGGIRYKVDVICSAVHAAKFIIAFIPGPVLRITSASSNVLRSSYHQQYDILNNKQFIFDVPYDSNQVFYPRTQVPTPGNNEMEPYGHIYIQLISNLTNNATVSESIELIISQCASPYLEFAIPNYPALLPSYDSDDTHKATFSETSALQGYWPYYVGTWYKLYSGTNYVPILRYGDVSDHIAQFQPCHKYSVYQLEPNSYVDGDKILKMYKNKEKQEAGVVYIVPIFDGTYTYAVPFLDKISASLFAQYYKQAKGWGNLDSVAPAYLNSNAILYARDWENDVANTADKSYVWDFIESYNLESLEESYELIHEANENPIDIVHGVQRMSLTHFGENTMNLKDLCRRYQLYCEVSITTPQKFLTTSAIIPITPWGLSLADSFDNVTPCRSLIGVIASGYLFYKGSINMTLICMDPEVKFWIQHHNDDCQNLDNVKIVNDVNESFTGMAQGYASTVYDARVNGILQFTIPYYSVANRIYANPCTAKVASNYQKQSFSLGSLHIGVSKPCEFVILYRIGDDAAFSEFVGFPPMLFSSDINNGKVVNKRILVPEKPNSNIVLDIGEYIMTIRPQDVYNINIKNQSTHNLFIEAYNKLPLQRNIDIDSNVREYNRLVRAMRDFENGLVDEQWFSSYTRWNIAGDNIVLQSMRRTYEKAIRNRMNRFILDHEMFLLPGFSKVDKMSEDITQTTEQIASTSRMIETSIGEFNKTCGDISSASKKIEETADCALNEVSNIKSGINEATTKVMDIFNKLTCEGFFSNILSSANNFVTFILSNLGHCLIGGLKDMWKHVVVFVVSLISLLTNITTEVYNRLSNLFLSLFTWRESTKEFVMNEMAPLTTTKLSLDHEGPSRTNQDIIIEIISLIVGSIAAVGTVKYAKHKIFGGSIIEFLKQSPKSIKNTQNIMEFLKGVWSLLLDIFGKVKILLFPKLSVIEPLLDQHERISQWVEEVMLLTHPDKWSEIVESALLQQRVDLAYHFGVELMFILSQYEKDANIMQLKKIVEIHHSEILKLHGKCHREKLNLGSDREPFFIYMWGPPGVGKTTLKDYLCTEMLRVANIKTNGNIFFPIPVNSPYWTGAYNQPVAYVDDFNLVADDTSVQMYLDIVTLKSTNVFKPNQADVSDKGRPYNPEILYICSNCDKPNIPNISDVGAFMRRPEVYVQVKMHPKYQQYKKISDIPERERYDVVKNMKHVLFGIGMYTGDYTTNTIMNYKWYEYKDFLHVVTRKFLKFRANQIVLSEDRFKTHLKNMNLDNDAEFLARASKFLFGKIPDTTNEENLLEDLLNQFSLHLVGDGKEKLLQRTIQKLNDSYKIQESLEDTNSRTHNFDNDYQPKEYKDESKLSHEAPEPKSVRVIYPLEDLVSIISAPTIGEITPKVPITEIEYDELMDLFCASDERISLLACYEKHLVFTFTHVSFRSNVAIMKINDNITDFQYKSIIQMFNADFDAWMESYPDRVPIPIREIITNRRLYILKCKNFIYDSLKKVKDVIVNTCSTIAKGVWKAWTILFKFGWVLPLILTTLIGVGIYRHGKSYFNAERDGYRDGQQNLYDDTLSVARCYLNTRVYHQASIGSDPTGKSKSHEKRSKKRQQTVITNRAKWLEEQLNHEQVPRINENIVDRVARNTFFIEFLFENSNITTKLRTLAIGGRKLLMPLHYIQSLEKYMKMPGFKCCITKDKYELFIDIKEVLESVENVWDSSLVTVVMPPQFPSQRSMEKMLYNDKEPVDKENVGFLVSVEGSRINTYVSGINVGPVEIRENDVMSAVDIRFAYVYGVHGPGMCGSVLIIGDKIVGMHVAGAGGVGAAEPIGNDIIDINDQIVLSENLLENFVDSSYEMELQGTYESVGYVIDSFKSFNPNETDIVPTEFMREIECDMVPAKLGIYEKDGCRISPLMEGVKCHLNKPLTFKKDLVKQASDHYGELLLSTAKPCRNEVGVMSMEQACDGIPGNKHFKSVDRSTSVGWPYIRMGKEFNTKVACIGRAGEVKINPELRDIVSKQIAERKKKVCQPTVFDDKLKDEVVTLEKSQKKDGTRIISCCPVDYLIASRMYMQDFVSSMSCGNFLTECAVGLNVLGDDWNELMLRMFSFSPYGFDGDYSKFGPNLSVQIIEECIRIINSWYDLNDKNNNEEKNNVRSCLIYELMFSHHLAGSDVYRTTSGAPSGSPITVILNSMVNCIYVRMAYLEINRELKSFYKQIRVITYGDDILIAVRNRKFLSFKLLHEVYKKWGIKFTMANKSDNVVELVSLKECTFLKSSIDTIKHNGRKVFLYCLDENSIKKLLCYVRKSKMCPISISVRTNCENALCFLTAHGEEKYEMYASIIRRVLLRYYTVQAVLPSYADMLERLFSGMLHSDVLECGVEYIN